MEQKENEMDGLGITDNPELEREARRVFRSLAAKGLFLAPEADGRYALAGTRRAGRLLRVSAPNVDAFRKRGWLEGRGTRPETFALSAEGARWFDRMNALPNPFAAQHQLRAIKLMKTDEGEKLVTFNEAESPLARLRVRGMITSAQHDAGEHLRRDFTLAHLMPRLCADLSAPISSGRGGAKTPPQAEAVLAAKQRFRLAMSAVGPGLSDLLFDVCCHLRGLESIEASNGWPVRSGKVVLQIALDRLAAHYGIVSPMRRSGRIRAWQAPAEKVEAIRLGV
jgi:hypothetical protein